MSDIDWSKAPEGAQFYVAGCFYRKDGDVYKFIFGDGDDWSVSLCQSHDFLMSQKDYEPRPQQWPDESRIDIIGTNGNTGEAYMKIYPLNGESMHYDDFRQDEQAQNKLGSAKNKYQRDIVGLDGTKTVIDVYRVLDAFNVDSHAIAHSIKKLLAPGLRHSKDRKQDLQEAIDSIAAELLLMEQK